MSLNERFLHDHHNMYHFFYRHFSFVILLEYNFIYKLLILTPPEGSEMYEYGDISN